MIKFEPIITTTKKGKEIKRYNTLLQKSNGKFSANVNIGVTPKGTRYYKALLPDKSWGSLYMLKKDGSEVIVDSCSSNTGIQASVLTKNKAGIITSDKYVEHVTKTGANHVHSDRMVGQTSKTFIQDDVKRAMALLGENIDILKEKPKSFFSKLWDSIK